MIVNRPGVFISGATAAYLEQHGLTRLRVRARGNAAPEVCRELEEIGSAATKHARSHPVREHVATSREQPAGSEWLTTTAAADFLRISPRGVQQAITRGSLAAKKDGRRHLVHRDDVETYKAKRSR